MATPAVTLRPMSVDELPLLAGWLGQPHVAEWWEGEPSDLPSVRANYAGHFDGTEKITMVVISVDGGPVGWLEWYWLHDHLDYAEGFPLPPDAIGVDISVGDPGEVGRGVGRRALGLLLHEVLPAEAPGFSAVFIDPDPNNERAVRCYAAAGFVATGDLLPNPSEPSTERKLMRFDPS